MKNLLLPAFCAFVILATGCTKDTNPNGNETSDAVYKSSCSAQAISWIDNESVILETHCGSNQYIINTVTKQERAWNVGSLIPQKHFSVPGIPGKLFFISQQPNTLWFALYSLDLTTLGSTMIKDSIWENPMGGNYFLAGKKIAIRNGVGSTMIIDLENGTTQQITNTGDVQGWSPDQSQLLFYTQYSVPIANASTFSFSCNCSQPISLSGEGNTIWRPQGMIGYYYRGVLAFSDTLLFVNRQTGASIRSYPTIIMGPWYDPGSDLIFLFKESSTYSSDSNGELISLNPFTGEEKQLVKAKHNIFFNSGVHFVALSPDKTKIAYLRDGIYLNVIRL